MYRTRSVAVQATLVLVIIGLVLIIALKLWQGYQAKLSFRTDNPSGNNLAARYLVLGSWPASNSNNLAVDQFNQFVIDPELRQGMPSDSSLTPPDNKDNKLGE